MVGLINKFMVREMSIMNLSFRHKAIHKYTWEKRRWELEKIMIDYLCRRMSDNNDKEGASK